MNIPDFTLTLDATTGFGAFSSRHEYTITPSHFDVFQVPARRVYTAPHYAYVEGPRAKRFPESLIVNADTTGTVIPVRGFAHGAFSATVLIDGKIRNCTVVPAATPTTVVNMTLDRSITVTAGTTVELFYRSQEYESVPCYYDPTYLTQYQVVWIDTTSGLSYNDEHYFTGMILQCSPSGNCVFPWLPIEASALVGYYAAAGITKMAWYPGKTNGPALFLPDATMLAQGVIQNNRVQIDRPDLDPGFTQHWWIGPTNQRHRRGEGTVFMPDVGSMQVDSMSTIPYFLDVPPYACMQRGGSVHYPGWVLPN